MPTATLEERVTSLERRKSDLEGQVGFLLPLVRQIHLDLLGFKEQIEERFEYVDERFEQTNDKIDHLDARIDAKIERLEARMDMKFKRLEDSMPRAVAETVVELLKKQR